MDVASLYFIVFLAVLAAAFQLVRGKAPRQFLLIAANTAFLFPFINNWQSWVALAAFVVAGFIMVRTTQSRLRGLGLALLIGGLLAPDHLLDHPIALIGVSYMLFKLVHMLVDGWQRELAPANFLTYANYQLGFFKLLAGPIQRYNDFARFWENLGNPPPEKRETLLAWSRILTGMLKMALLGGLALTVYDRASTTALHTESSFRAVAAFTAMFYAYPAFVYFNFSGYTDIVIGAGRLFGLGLPENFNRPTWPATWLTFGTAGISPCLPGFGITFSWPPINGPPPGGASRRAAWATC
jgi:alginate O-acetyltransferase complex protein AlgI